MANIVQCEECGAVLAKNDLFCPECKAVRPPGTDLPEPAVESPVPAPSSPPAPRSAPSPVARYRAAFIVLVVLGIITCILALVSFVIVGALPSETTTVQEDWLIAGFCCLLPVGLVGSALLIASIVVRRRMLKLQ